MAEPATSPELVLSHLDSLPTLPAVAIKVLEITADEQSAANDVIRLLRGDQSLTAKILSLAGSAAMGVRQPVTTLEKAVPLLGYRAIRSIVLATSVFDTLMRPKSEGNKGSFDQMEFWRHSLAVACAARRLARARADLKVDPEDAFVGGLLHDLGKVALDTVFPKAYDRIVAQTNHSRGDIADNERAILGADHTVAGRRLAERWRLPRGLQEVIWLHHLAAEALPTSVSNPKLIAIVQLADTVAREQRIGYSGNYMFYEMSPRLAERVGFTTQQVAEVIRPLTTDVAEHASLLGLDGETAEVAYVKAMTRANAELGRLNTELLASNRRLTAGARYFKAITRFEHELRDWSDPSAVVEALTEAAATALQRPRVTAFGLRDDRVTVDISWVSTDADERGHRTEPVPEDVARWMQAAAEDSGRLVIQAPQAVRELLAGSLADADTGTPWLLPIVHVGELVGGVVYLSEADERSRLTEEAEDLRSFLASLGLALGRANAQAAARRLSEELAATNRRLQQMQTELLRSRALSMIAEMAAGAGHELNGPLTVISGRAQMMQSHAKDPESQRALKTITDKAHECSGIVSELMDFARPRPAQLEAVRLDELLDEVRAEVLERSSRPPSQIRIEPPAFPGVSFEPPVIQADRGQLKTVLRELLSNALDAVAEGQGQISLRWQDALQPESIEILVHDDGCGMDPAVLQRAFDPFYSHRNAGRGRGLGLPRAYRIVESHGGRVWLESQPGAGTTAHVLLPREAVPPQF